MCIIVTTTSSVNAYVAGGHEYEASCSADGYVLTSLYPVARTMGQGADTEIVSGVEKLYLGRSCDAFHPIFGKGEWCWANGGFIANFDGMEFGFARQELFCSSDEDLGLECRCQ
jgi:hypothetical protein